MKWVLIDARGKAWKGCVCMCNMHTHFKIVFLIERFYWEKNERGHELEIHLAAKEGLDCNSNLLLAIGLLSYRASIV